VSIVVNNFNNESYLRECLDGLITQTYPHLEIVVVDARSTDGSRSVIDSYAIRDERIRVLYCDQYVRYPAITYNIGFLNCAGAFIAINDPDDVSLPERIESQLDVLLRNPAIDAVGCNCYEFNDSMNRLVETTAERNVLNALPPVRNPCLMFRREVLAEHGLWRWQSEYAADFEWLYRWYAGGVRFEVLQLPLVRFRKNSPLATNISAKKATHQAAKLAWFRTLYGIRLFPQVGLQWWSVTFKTYAYVMARLLIPGRVLDRYLRKR